MILNLARILIFLSAIVSFSQDKSDVEIQYSFNGKLPAVVIHKDLDFIYSSFNKSILGFEQTKYNYNQKLSGKYLFTEVSKKDKNNFLKIDFFLCNDLFLTDNFYSRNGFEKFSRLNGKEVINENYYVSYTIEKNLKVTEYYFKIDSSKFLRAVVLSKNDLVWSVFSKDQLFVGFDKFLKENQNYPKKISELLNQFFYKDFNSQIELIESFNDTIYSMNSRFSPLLVNLNTNNGTLFKVKDLITQRIKLEIEASKLTKLDQYIAQIDTSIDVVMFNEFHSYPHTRFNFMYALKELKKLGFEYLALETLPSPSPNDSLITPLSKLDGYYVDEPTCSLMINYAANLGFKLVAYEVLNQCENLLDFNKRNCRDSIQATNIGKIFKKDKEAKILIFGGHAHIEKKTRDDWKFMRVVLQEIFPDKKIISIGQTKYISTNLDSLDFPTEQPLVYLGDDKQFDANMISPYYQEYYQWYYKKSNLMNRKIKLNNKKDFYIVEIVPIFKDKEIYFPIFRAKKESLLKNTIFLPDNIKYKVIYKNKNNKRI